MLSMRAAYRYTENIRQKQSVRPNIFADSQNTEKTHRTNKAFKVLKVIKAYKGVIFYQKFPTAPFLKKKAEVY